MEKDPDKNIKSGILIILIVVGFLLQLDWGKDSAKKDANTLAQRAAIPAITTEDVRGVRQSHGYWDENTVKLKGCNVHPFQLNPPIYCSSELLLRVDLDMKHNTSCEDWDVFALIDWKWKDIADITIPGGNGYSENLISISPTEDIHALALVPKKAGSYSWSCSLEIWEYEARNSET